MDKFVIKKRKCVEEATGSEVMIDDEPNSAGPSVCPKKTLAGASKSKPRRSYQDSYLALGFTWCDDELGPKPKCVVCGTELSNEAMVPSKMKRHLTTKHSHLSDKPLDYFKRLLNDNKQQRLSFEKKVKVAEKAQEASYLVAELIAKNMKPHTIAESLILPSCCAIVRTMFGAEAEKEVKKIPLSDNTISRRIQEMSSDIEKSVCELVKEKGMYALQVDESTDVAGKAQLLVFIRYIAGNQITEQFLCCRELVQTTGQDVFSTVSDYLQSVDLTWKSCVGICTDGAPSMVGTVKGFVSLVKKENPDLITTHCFLHREALVAKTLGNELRSVLDDIVKMVNFIKSRPVKSRLFSLLCEEMESPHVALILHTEVRWLSRGRVLSRVHELKEEMLTFFTLEEKIEFCELLADETWCGKLCYLADIFEHLNNVNTSMQGRGENLLSSSDKMKALAEKMRLWNVKVKEGNLDMFRKTADIKNKDIVPLICEHLESLEKNIEKYFPNICVENYDWLRNPFIPDPSNKLQLSLCEEEELTDIRNDRTLKLKYMEMSLQTFWISIEDEFPHLAKKAQKILLQFSTSYLCELGFSTLTNIKSKKRSRLLSVEEEMRVCLSSIPPNIPRICKSSQAHVSH